MPTNLTDSATFTSPVAVPAGSDSRTAASVQTPFQSLANRTYYLQQVCEVLGVPRIKAVADLTALKALSLSGISDGDLRVAGYSGVFRYTAGASMSEQLPMIATPNVGSGRWISVVYNMAGAANGLASLDANARLAQLAPLGRVYEGGYALSSGTVGSNSTTSYTDVAAMTISIGTAVALDVLRINIHGRIDASGTTGTIRVVVTENGGSVIPVPGMTRAVAPGTDILVSMTGRNVVASGGPLVLKVQLLSSVGATPVYLQAPSAISYELVRP
jgi:hypothetical protein